MAVLGTENAYKLQLKTRKFGTILSAAMIVFEAHLRFQKRLSWGLFEMK